MLAPAAFPWSEVVRAYVLLQRIGDAVVPSFGLATYEMHLLQRLRRQPPMTQVELGRRVQRDAMSVSRLVRSLEARGLVCREPSPHDARARLVTLTPRGEALVDEVEARLGAVRLEDWSDDEIRAFGAVLRRMVVSLEAACVWEGIAPERSDDPRSGEGGKADPGDA